MFVAGKGGAADWLMTYVICYDIADDGRRYRLASALLDFGTRVEESVFVAQLDEELAARMRERVRRAIDVEADRVHIFELCGACAKKSVALGTGEVVEDKDFYII